MPRRKVGFFEVELGLLGVEERMKTPTPTRTWGGWGGILLGGFRLVFSFLVALGAWLVCLFACFRRWLLLL